MHGKLKKTIGLKDVEKDLGLLKTISPINSENILLLLYQALLKKDVAQSERLLDQFLNITTYSTCNTPTDQRNVSLNKENFEFLETQIVKMMNDLKIFPLAIELFSKHIAFLTGKNFKSISTKKIISNNWGKKYLNVWMEGNDVLKEDLVHRLFEKVTPTEISLNGQALALSLSLPSSEIFRKEFFKRITSENIDDLARLQLSQNEMIFKHMQQNKTLFNFQRAIAQEQLNKGQCKEVALFYLVSLGAYDVNNKWWYVL